MPVIESGPARPLSVPDAFFQSHSRQTIDWYIAKAKAEITGGILAGRKIGASTAIAVLQELRSRYHFKTGTLCVEVRTLADALGLRRETVQRIISALSQVGLLEIKHRHTRTGGYRANAYRFAVNWLRNLLRSRQPEREESQGCAPGSHLYKDSNPCSDSNREFSEDKNPEQTAKPEEISQIRHLRSMGAGERMTLTREIRNRMGEQTAKAFAWLVRPREGGPETADLLQAARLLLTGPYSGKCQIENNLESLQTDPENCLITSN